MSGSGSGLNVPLVGEHGVSESDNVCKKYLSTRSKRYFLIISILLVTTTFIYYTLYLADVEDVKSKVIFEQNSLKNIVDIDGSVTCHLPKLNPFNPKMIMYFKGPEKYNCTKKYPLLFYTDEKSNLILNATLKETNFDQCCYKELFRANGTSDSKHEFSSNCEPIINNVTKIQESMEFIAIFCVNQTSKKFQVVDMFGFVHPKPDVEKRCEKIADSEDSQDTEDPINVVIFGIDSISRLNFIRTMPKTYSFITKNLSAISMDGFTKVGESTLPNIFAALGDMTWEEANSTCFGQTNYFDTCYLIWRNFTSAGYRTLFGEDAPNMAIFNWLKKGFMKPPTDYYLRPLIKAQKDALGNEGSVNVHLCYGPQLAFNILLDYLKKAAYTFRKGKKYFQFIWSSNLSHDLLNNPKIGDESLFRALKWLHSGNYLNNSVLILMSDHGMRFGKFRNTYQGSIEGRLPYLFTMFPKWFSEKYPVAVKYFESNIERLTTCFDVHQTLKDLMDLRNITNERISERVKNLSVGATTSTEKGGRKPKGISLFLPIPLSRTCADAHIAEHFCVCNEMQPVPINSEITSVGEAAVDFINNVMLLNHTECSQLQLKSVTNARKAVLVNKDILKKTKKEKNINEKLSYIINFITSPGDAIFEVSAFRNTMESHWVVSNSISRTNLYGNQSDCVNDKNLKNFCNCII